MSAYFCTKTGCRIVAPGVSKAVDPENGQDDFIEASESEPKGSKPKKSDKSEDEKSDKDPKDDGKAPPATGKAGSESEPKGSK